MKPTRLLKGKEKRKKKWQNGGKYQMMFVKLECIINFNKFRCGKVVSVILAASKQQDLKICVAMRMV